MGQPRLYRNNAERQAAYRERKAGKVSEYTAEPESGWVYMILADAFSLVKIGFSRNVDKRLASLRDSSPTSLELLFAVESDRANLLEAELHRKWDDKRHHGEWFHYTPEMLDDMGATT